MVCDYVAAFLYHLLLYDSVLLLIHFINVPHPPIRFPMLILMLKPVLLDWGLKSALSQLLPFGSHTQGFLHLPSHRLLSERTQRYDRSRLCFNIFEMRSPSQTVVLRAGLNDGRGKRISEGPRCPESRNTTGAPDGLTVRTHSD